MNTNRRLAALFLPLAIGIFCAAEPAAKPKVKVTISKETTYITEPLREDGYPDYVAALNQRMSKGVTPENNAALLLQKAFGPSEIPANMREKYFKQLGIDPLPEQGDYFVSESEMINRWKAKQPGGGQNIDDDELEKQFDLARERPWADSDLPLVAEWLRINEKPLDLVIQATKREKSYFPILVGKDQLLIAALLPHLQLARDAVNALVADALRKVAQGKTNEAWQRLLVSHRLARLVARGFCIVEALSGYGIETISASADLAFAHCAKLSSKQARQCGADINSLPQFPDVVETINTGERFSMLGTATLLSRKGPYEFINLVQALAQGGANAKRKEPTKEQIEQADKLIDWDIPLKLINQSMDRYVAACRISDRAQREKAGAELDEEINKAGRQVSNQGEFFKDMFSKKSPTEVVSPRVGKFLVAFFLPATRRVVDAQVRTIMLPQMEGAAFALAAFRADNGRYPQSLEALVPKYLEKVPVDAFSPERAPLRYKLEGDGYVIWTVHLNGVDDGGPPADDDVNSTSDDFGLRPLPPSKGKPEVR